MLYNYINFDESSKEWRKNKRKLKNGYFQYTCNYIHTNGKRCRKIVLSSKIENIYIYKFGDNGFIDNYKNHPNKDFFCKQHINRFRI